MSKVLYRVERPETLNEVLGQDHVVKILKHQIATDTIAHAYLLSGIRGTGKTTVARLIAKAANCLSNEDIPCGTCENCIAISQGNFVDVMEIDAATQTGIEGIRELKENTKFMPMIGKKKVYIIDEVHMISKSAANAFLKTLEEPPEHIILILATTDPQALPATVLSRCLKLDFKRVSEKIISNNMERICKIKNIEISKEALGILATNADGSVRDSLSLLDQCMATGTKNIGRDDILELLGALSSESYINLTESIMNNDVGAVLVEINEAVNSGKDARQIMRDWVAHYRNLLIIKYTKNPENILNTTTEIIDKIKEQAEKATMEEIKKGITVFTKAINDSKHTTHPRILLELSAITMTLGDYEMPAYQGERTFRDIGNATDFNEKKNKPQAIEEKVEPSKESNKGEEKSYSEKPKETKEELEKIWMKALDSTKSAKGSFAIIKRCVTLQQIESNKFLLLANSDVAMEYVCQEEELIVGLMEKATGVRRHMQCILKGSETESENLSQQEEAKRLGQMLNLEITAE